jgi:SAM-dependent methyltransferase
LLCLLGAAVIVGALMVGLPPHDETLLQWAWLHGALAASLGWATTLPRWWVPILLLFMPTAVGALALDVPPLLWLAAGLLPWLVFRGVVRDRVPLFLSDAPATRHLLELITDEHPVSVVDLGCGTGGLLLTLRESRPIARLTGIENAPLTWLIARLRLTNAAIEVTYGSIWDAPLDRYDVVYAYLSPAAMPRLWAKASREMRAGSLLVSNSFEVPGVAPDRFIPLDGTGMATALYVWEMGSDTDVASW